MGIINPANPSYTNNQENSFFLTLAQYFEESQRTSYF